MPSERAKSSSHRVAARDWTLGEAAKASSAIASRQKGVVTRVQLLATGVPRRLIESLIRNGFLYPLHRGVYAVGHLALPQFATEQAALLACGEESVLSGRSALYVWGIVGAPPAEVEVAVPDHRRRRRRGIRLRRGQIDPRDIRTRHGLRVSFPALALIEFAADASADELGDAVAEARVKNLIREGELEATADAARRRRGAARMRAFLKDEGGPAITRSHAERRFRSLLRDAQLPRPEVNRRVAGLRVDFLWEAEQVVLEVDGWQFHRHRRAFENDRKRDRILSDAGYHVIRVTWRQFTEEPLALIAHIARILDRRSRVPH